MGEGPRSRTGEYSRMDLARSCSNQPRRSPRLPHRTREGKPCVGVVFTEDGALKMARLTKSHIGEFLAIILDGRVTWVPKIRAEITGGRAMIEGNFTEEETGSIAKGLSGDQAVEA